MKSALLLPSHRLCISAVTLLLPPLLLPPLHLLVVRLALSPKRAVISGKINTCFVFFCFLLLRKKAIASASEYKSSTFHYAINPIPSPALHRSTPLLAVPAISHHFPPCQTLSSARAFFSPGPATALPVTPSLPRSPPAPPTFPLLPPSLPACPPRSVSSLSS